MPSNPGPRKDSGQLFKPGNKISKGRQLGSRNKLSENYLDAMHADFAKHGVSVIVRVREEFPDKYLALVAALLPKQVEVKEGAFDGVNDEELAALVTAARETLAAFTSSGDGSEDEGGKKSLN